MGRAYGIHIQNGESDCAHFKEGGNLQEETLNLNTNLNKPTNKQKGLVAHACNPRLNMLRLEDHKSRQV
jgi:hypothetical protein